jgi:hypothetical protein
MNINVSTAYPIFTSGQQLTSSSLTGIVDFAKLEEQDTRVYLEGSGIFYGLQIEWDAANGTLRLLPGTAVTSDGQLFAVETELVYNGIRKKDNQDLKVELLQKKDVPVFALTTDGSNHAELVNHFNGPDANEYIIILAVSSDQTSKASCLYGFENNVSEKSLMVELALVNKNVFTQQELDRWFVTDHSEAGDKDPVMNRFGFLQDHISFERFTSFDTLTQGFSEVTAAAEQGIGEAYKQLYNLVKDKLSLNDPANPFDNLAANLTTLRTGLTNARLLPFLYDYYRDLIAAYQEFVSTDIFSFLSFTPDKERFRGYIALGSIRTGNLNYRMGLYRPPFADLSINALEKPRLLMKRMISLASNTNFVEALLAFNVKLTPDAGLNKILSDRSIPFYYKDKDALSKLWNANLTRINRTFTIPGVVDDQDRKAFLTNIDTYNFYRLKGHIGSSIQDTQEAIATQREDLHLPFDIRVVYLATEDDMRELIIDRSANFSDLSVILEKIVDDIRCSRTCGDKFEEAIFEGKFERGNIGDMFARLADLFGSRTLEQNLAALCNDNAGLCQDIVCCTAQITSLYAVCQEYLRRREELLDGLLFHRFARQHTGLEHNGGVPRGGTLVLVCAKRQIASLAAEDKEKLMQLMASRDVTKLQELADELLNYEVVADFCLPYICCSSKPSIKLELHPAPPVALFTETARVALPNNQGYKVTLTNESLRADTHFWQVFDSNDNEIATKETYNLDPVDFDFKFETGIVYQVVLTAYRDGVSDQYTGTITICPQGKVTLLSAGASEVKWDYSKGEPVPVVPAPYGGTFSLVFDGDSTEDVPEDEYTIVWFPDNKKASFNVIQPMTGTYILRYGFSDIANCEPSFAELKIEASRPPVSGTRGVPVKRSEAYLGGIASAEVDDPALKNEVAAYVNGNGDYETVVNNLLTGFSKLKVAQKAQIARLLIFATAQYIDQQLAESPDKVSAAVKKAIKPAADAITSQKEGVAMWNAVWTTDSITTDENRKAIAIYKGLIS